jgi:hypothetical protein
LRRLQVDSPDACLIGCPCLHPGDLLLTKKYLLSVKLKAGKRRSAACGPRRSARQSGLKGVDPGR